MNIVELIRVQTKPCVHCGETGIVTVPLSEWDAYLAGATVQAAFTSLFYDADTREQIMTGTHAACWDEMFSDEEI